MGELLLSDALSTLYGLRDAGISPPTGAPARSPVVTEATLDAVTITDCVDTRPWPAVDASGTVVSVDSPPSEAVVRVIFDEVLLRWLVVEQTADLETMC